MHYRLGLDIGANSIGWCVLSLDEDNTPSAIVRMGVRIFADGRNPKDGSSLAATRRLKRQMRRMRDRYVLRRDRLMQKLVLNGLMPSDESARKALQGLDPYALRAKGLQYKLPLHHLGRAIFHLNQRRGFKSNRKADRDPKEVGPINSGVEKLKQAMDESGAATLGQFLHNRRMEGLSVRSRLQGQGTKASYEFYPDRALLEEEFDLLWQAQARFHPQLTLSMREDIEKELFFQRPLKPVEPGKCTFLPHEPRAPWALPLTQHFRILQELGNLMIVGSDFSQRPLNREERDTILAKLLERKTVSFDAMRKLLHLPGDSRFNLESEKRKDLKGDETAALLSRKELFGKIWRQLSFQLQNQVAQWLLNLDDPASGVTVEDVIERLVTDCGQERERAKRIAAVSMPDRYARLGRTAMMAIVRHMDTECLPYFAAAAKAGFHHSDLRTGEVFERLPYYGIPLNRHTMSVNVGCEEEVQYGRIANPTVHIGLNQLRKLVNAMIEAWGPPTQVVLELARELKQSREKRREIEKRQSEEQLANERRAIELAQLGLERNAENLLKFRLWEELNKDPSRRRCIYTGEVISLERLFSPDVEVEHILPFSRTLDNSAANKTVSLRRANRIKDRQSPWEAFGQSPDGYDWEGILVRVKGLPENKQWRFSDQAMSRFEGEGDFLARHLTDTQYLASAAREYLTCICDQVWVTPGRLTAMLRGKWGLNKSRVDHRHHAVDAAVIAATDRKLLQRVARAAARCEEEGAARILREMPVPYDGFRDDIQGCFLRIVVSHKPDHNVLGGLHNDTAYGPGIDSQGKAVAVHRAPLAGIGKAADAKKIRDPHLRERILELFVDDPNSATVKQRLAEFSERTGVRRVRIEEALDLIPVHDAAGKFYKGLKGDSNAFVEVYRKPDGNWGLEVVSTFAANRPNPFDTIRQRQSLPLIMRIYKGDLLALGSKEERRIYRIVKIRQDQKKLFLAMHNESGDLKKRDADKKDPFRYLPAPVSSLQKNSARKVSVDVLCRVRDPGP